MKGSHHGLTLVEVLAVLTASVFLFLAVPSCLQRCRELTWRAVCGANLNSMGKAMYLYEGEQNDGHLPRVAPFVTGADSGDWLSAGVATDDGWDPMGRVAQGATQGEARQNALDAMFNPKSTQPCAVGGSPTASLFLLLRSLSLKAKDLLCPSDRFGEVDLLREARLELMVDVAKKTNCSYSLAMPWGRNVDWTLKGHPRSVLAADLSPVGVVTDAQVLSVEQDGNSRTHRRTGQNVLHRDASVTWETSNRCGIGGDNIFTVNTSGANANAPGNMPTLTETGGSACLPRDVADTVMTFYGRDSHPTVAPKPELGWVWATIGATVLAGAAWIVWMAMKRSTTRADRSDP